MTTDPWVDAAVADAQASGFLGHPVAVEMIGDDRHGLAVVTCGFADGSRSLYVAVADLHEGGGRPTLLALSEAVHLLQNASDQERWTIASREPAP